jgi:hypothetical protein
MKKSSKVKEKTNLLQTTEFSLFSSYQLWITFIIYCIILSINYFMVNEYVKDPYMVNIHIKIPFILYLTLMVSLSLG